MGSRQNVLRLKLWKLRQCMFKEGSFRPYKLGSSLLPVLHATFELIFWMCQQLFHCSAFNSLPTLLNPLPFTHRILCLGRNSHTNWALSEQLRCHAGITSYQIPTLTTFTMNHRDISTFLYRNGG